MDPYLYILLKLFIILSIYKALRSAFKNILKYFLWSLRFWIILEKNVSRSSTWWIHPNWCTNVRPKTADTQSGCHWWCYPCCQGTFSFSPISPDGQPGSWIPYLSFSMIKAWWSLVILLALMVVFTDSEIFEESCDSMKTLLLLILEILPIFNIYKVGFSERHRPQSGLRSGLWTW